MEHYGMVFMFKTLEDTGLKGFMEESGSVYEAVVVEFFTNEKVIAGTIVSFISNRKLALMKDVSAEAFGLPIESMPSFLDTPNKTMLEMRKNFSGTDMPSGHQSRREMKLEFRLLHDIMSKALCASSGSFDVVTSEKFDLMVAITAGMKVNWAQVLFQGLTMGAIVVRSGPEQPAQQYMTFAGMCIFTPMEIREINWATYFLPKINLSVKGKEILYVFPRPTPVEEHCQLVLKSTWEDVSDKMAAFDEWVHFCTEHLVDEVASLKSKVAEMVDCLKELRDAKNGEGPSSKNGEGTSSTNKRRRF
ncbi:hypothetical protein F511_40010 [Dorcoceras hygrometricum]|uniref:Uncharacterized protein n=1 Tax=Dorcoceras hygrometricum TaxID=472368 RepID=A0A2Z7B5Y3_9LAMI|nr:hypothetical protein F511_40010 [Dorcoceras hygrometricum]